MKLWSPTNALNLRKLTARTVLGQIRFESVMSRRPVGRPPCDRRVVTLDPARLVALQQAALDVSELWQPIIHTANGKIRIRYGSVIGVSASNRFPRGTRGFLYYHRQPDRPRISGQLRFRITPSDDLASFSYGYDLKQPTSRLRPWTLPLVCSIARESKKHILSQLENDGLIDHSLVQSLHNLHSLRRHDPRAHYLFTLFDPWEINFSNSLMILRAVTELGQGEIKFSVPHLGPHRSGRVNFKSGVFKVCFEKSTLPQHRGKQVVVARCLDMLEPLVMEAPKIGQDVNPVDLATYTPIPGQLLQCLPVGCHLAQTTPRPWSIDVSDGSTHPAAPGIRLLW
ncbi:hypothetical protein BJ165DRAFT_1510297 [Panaeolus papilionaceus]|nr:hypothetical protein BJ165DRAFT_1510297 [Panaeolus papilionaceus]